jgi:ATP-binding protein involved in chromosome partitioning
MSDANNAAGTALGALVYGPLGKTLAELNLVKSLDVADGKVSAAIELPSPFERDAVRGAAEKALLALPSVKEVELKTSVRIQARAVASDDPVPGVKNVVMVLSGKGGVGKSTTAVNLATAYARAGLAVGLLDADMYGPSIPTMLGVNGRPTSSDGKHIDPLDRFGVKLMSLGFLLEDDKTAVVWRGPMLHGALVQFVQDVAWGKLDVLVVDLPPGTGDVALTMAQKVPASGAIVVTTPQEVALADVYKSVSMCQKVHIPMLGVVENMSTFVCPHCQHESPLFGKGGGDKVAEFAGAPLLGRIPIDPSVRECGDGGTPVVQYAPESAPARAFTAVAASLLDVLTNVHYKRKGTLDEPKMQVRLPIMR